MHLRPPSQNAAFIAQRGRERLRYRTTKELAQFTGLSERAVCTHIENAAKLGWLKKSQHDFRGQKWKRNEYGPLWPKGTEPGSAASKKALNVVQERAEPDDKKPLKQVQQDKDISRNISNPSPVAQSRDGGEFSKLWNEWPEASRPVNAPTPRNSLSD